MKHLHFVQSIEPLEGGGLGRAAVNLHEALLAVGESSVLVTTCRGTPPPQTNGIFQFPRRGPSKAYYSPQLWSNAQELVQPADVIHGHGFYTAVNWAFGRAARKAGHPLVYHPHGMLEPWILSRSRKKKALSRRLFEDANFRHVALWRALTTREAEQIQKLGFPAPVVVAPNGIETNEFDMPAPKVEKERGIILFLGRIHPKKGLPVLVDAWSRMRNFYDGWEVVIAGPDEQNHRVELERRIGALGLEATIRFVGVVTGQQRLAWLKAADIFVLPSHSEGFSVAILEALASRIPVLATHACNFPEIETEQVGWLCEPQVESLRASLETAINAGDSERQKRGQAGRTLVERDYTWIPIARKICAAIRANIT